MSKTAPPWKGSLWGNISCVSRGRTPKFSAGGPAGRGLAEALSSPRTSATPAKSSSSQGPVFACSAPTSVRTKAIRLIRAIPPDGMNLPEPTKRTPIRTVRAAEIPTAVHSAGGRAFRLQTNTRTRMMPLMPPERSEARLLGSGESDDPPDDHEQTVNEHHVLSDKFHPDNLLCFR